MDHRQRTGGDAGNPDQSLLRHSRRGVVASPRQAYPSSGEHGLVNVMVQLVPAAAEAVQTGRELPPELRAAEAGLHPLKLALEPLHPGAQDRALGSWFRIAFEDETSAEAVARTLRELNVVESAYVEPVSAPPS